VFLHSSLLCSGSRSCRGAQVVGKIVACISHAKSVAVHEKKTSDDEAHFVHKEETALFETGRSGTCSWPLRSVDSVVWNPDDGQLMSGSLADVSRGDIRVRAT
jgi:hypothetical protein